MSQGAAMTFPLVCYCNAVPRPIVAVFRFIHATALAFVLVLCLLGLYEFPYTPDDDPPLINGQRRRAPARDSLPPETVKQLLPSVEFLAHLAAEAADDRRPTKTMSRHGDHDDDDQAATTTCRVCLERLEMTDEVRRLGNCAHAFHTGCIDQWIDVGEATCPLCRSSLLPRQRRRSWGLLARVRFG